MQNADWRRFNLVRTSSIFTRRRQKTRRMRRNNEAKTFRIEIAYAKPAVKKCNLYQKSKVMMLERELE